MKLPNKSLRENMIIARRLFPHWTPMQRKAYAKGASDAEIELDISLHRSAALIESQRARLIAELGPRYLCDKSNHIERKTQS